MKKGIIALLLMSQFENLCAQKRSTLGEYFLLQGQLFEVNPFTQEEGKAAFTQVKVYQGDEIYVAFDSKSSGKYEFYLPLGHLYTVAYGGGKYVNKMVLVDATASPNEKKPRMMQLNIGLFAPIEGASFPALEQPYVKIAYSKEYDDFVPDFDHTETMMKQLDKEIKLAKKSRSKSLRQAAALPQESDKDR
jgi:hypothetical protein